MQSGSNSNPTKQLIFERTTDVSVLSDFFCGINSMDEFIHDELRDYVSMGNCQLYVVREGEEIVAMFCLDNNSLFLANTAIENMQKGVKPCPPGTSDPDSPFWYKPSFDAIEIT